MSSKYSDEFLGDLELKQDLLYERIPMEQRSEYVASALELGRKYAEKCPKASISKLLQDAGVELEEQGRSGKLFSTEIRAQYEDDRHGKSKIIYYRESIEEIASSAQINYERALNIHLAHEYFHYLELKSGKPINEQLPVVALPSIFGWKRTATILRTSEIGANAFAKSYLQLPILPNYYDYLYLINKGKLDSNWLDIAQQAYADQTESNS
ncbi:hypothetical protein [Lapidilactobacillus salsurivasis]